MKYHVVGEDIIMFCTKLSNTFLYLSVLEFLMHKINFATFMTQSSEKLRIGHLNICILKNSNKNRGRIVRR